MQYPIVISAFAALASALAISQATNTDVDGVNIILIPSYGCLATDPIATVDAGFLDGACHSFGAFNSTQTRLCRTDVKQYLTFYEDETCTTVADVLTNDAAGGPTVADGDCLNAPQGQSFKAVTYQASPI